MTISSSFTEGIAKGISVVLSINSNNKRKDKKPKLVPDTAPRNDVKNTSFVKIDFTSFLLTPIILSI